MQPWHTSKLVFSSFSFFLNLHHHVKEINPACDFSDVIYGDCCFDAAVCLAASETHLIISGINEPIANDLGLNEALAFVFCHLDFAASEHFTCILSNLSKGALLQSLSIGIPGPKLKCLR